MTPVQHWEPDHLASVPRGPKNQRGVSPLLLSLWAGQPSGGVGLAHLFCKTSPKALMVKFQPMPAPNFSDDVGFGLEKGALGLGTFAVASPSGHCALTG